MSKRTKGGKVKNPPAVEVSKDMLGKNTVCQFCHQVSLSCLSRLISNIVHLHLHLHLHLP